MGSNQTGPERITVIQEYYPKKQQRLERHAADFTREHHDSKFRIEGSRVTVILIDPGTKLLGQTRWESGAHIRGGRGEAVEGAVEGVDDDEADVGLAEHGELLRLLDQPRSPLPEADPPPPPVLDPPQHHAPTLPPHPPPPPREQQERGLCSCRGQAGSEPSWLSPPPSIRRRFAGFAPHGSGILAGKDPSSWARTRVYESKILGQSK